MGQNICRKLKKVSTPYNGIHLKSASGRIISPSAMCTARINIQGKHHHVQFIILPSCSHDIILGWDFLAANNAFIDCAKPELSLETESFVEPSNTTSSQRCTITRDTLVPARMSVIMPIAPEYAYIGDALVESAPDIIWKKDIVVPSCMATFGPFGTDVLAVNVTNLDIVVPQSMVVAVATPSTGFNLLDVSVLDQPAEQRASSSTTDLDSTINPALSYDQKARILSLIESFRHAYDSQTDVLGRAHSIYHTIDTGDAPPIRHRPYRIAPVERRKIETEVTEMLKRNVIRPSNSSWSSPVVLVRKKDGSVRFCVDYRKLNNVTRKDSYPMPRIDDALDTLQGAKYYSSLDLRSGYWQIPMSESDKQKTAFVTPDGLFEFNVMPFGLCNAPATFERTIDSILRGLKWRTCLCYLDDVIIFSSTF